MMNKVVAASRTNEINALAMQMIALYKKTDWTTDTHLTGVFAQLKPLTDELTHSIKFISIESDLEKKDDVRDNRTRAIHYLLLGFLHSSNEQVKGAAIALDTIFETYGLSIIHRNYAEQSSLTESLLKDLSVTSLENDITALPGMSAAIESLEEAHRSFEQTRVDYEEQKSRENQYESATVLKRAVRQVINEHLVVYLRAMVQVDNAKYAAFANAIGQLIETNNMAVRKRRNKGEDTFPTPNE